MNTTALKNTRRRRRKLSVRRRVRRQDMARLSVHRSSKHIYAQILDEASGRTVCGVGTTAKSLSGELNGKTKTERAEIIGREIARLASEKGVAQVVFDRGFAKYHGRVKALADAARGAGLKI